jgi:hypothetical protein
MNSYSEASPLKDLYNLEPNILLYTDEFVDVTPSYFNIKKMFYPLQKVVSIPMNDIQSIKLIKMGNYSGKGTFMGFCLKMYYFHLDRKRPLKEKAIIIHYKGNPIRIGITPTNIDKCYNILTALTKSNNNNKGNEIREMNIIKEKTE